MKKKFLLLLFLSGFLIINGYSQGSSGSACPDASIFDFTNSVDCSGQTIQLTCPMPFVTLSPKVFAPGASSGYIVEQITYNPPCPYNISPTAVHYTLPSDDIWGQVMSLDFGQQNIIVKY